MLPKCCVCHFKKNKVANKRRIFFFQIPTEKDLRQQWVHSIQTVIHNPCFTPRANDLVCSKHFYDHHLSRQGRRVQLKPGSLPTPLKEIKAHKKKLEIPPREKENLSSEELNGEAALVGYPQSSCQFSQKLIDSGDGLQSPSPASSKSKDCFTVSDASELSSKDSVCENNRILRDSSKVEALQVDGHTFLSFNSQEDLQEYVDNLEDALLESCKEKSLYCTLEKPFPTLKQDGSITEEFAIFATSALKIESVGPPPLVPLPLEKATPVECQSGPNSPGYDPPDLLCAVENNSGLNSKTASQDSLKGHDNKKKPLLPGSRMINTKLLDDYKPSACSLHTLTLEDSMREDDITDEKETEDAHVSLLKPQADQLALQTASPHPNLLASSKQKGDAAKEDCGSSSKDQVTPPSEGASSHSVAKKPTHHHKRTTHSKGREQVMTRKLRSQKSNDIISQSSNLNIKDIDGCLNGKNVNQEADLTSSSASSASILQTAIEDKISDICPIAQKQPRCDSNGSSLRGKKMEDSSKKEPTVSAPPISKLRQIARNPNFKAHELVEQENSRYDDQTIDLTIKPKQTCQLVAWNRFHRIFHAGKIHVRFINRTNLPAVILVMTPDRIVASNISCDIKDLSNGVQMPQIVKQLLNPNAQPSEASLFATLYCDGTKWELVGVINYLNSESPKKVPLIQSQGSEKTDSDSERKGSTLNPNLSKVLPLAPPVGHIVQDSPEPSSDDSQEISAGELQAKKSANDHVPVESLCHCSEEATPLEDSLTATVLQLSMRTKSPVPETDSDSERKGSTPPNLSNVLPLAPPVGHIVQYSPETTSDDSLEISAGEFQAKKSAKDHVPVESLFHFLEEATPLEDSKTNKLTTTVLQLAMRTKSLPVNASGHWGKYKTTAKMSAEVEKLSSSSVVESPGSSSSNPTIIPGAQELPRVKTEINELEIGEEELYDFDDFCTFDDSEDCDDLHDDDTIEVKRAKDNFYKLRDMDVEEIFEDLDENAMNKRQRQIEEKLMKLNSKLYFPLSTTTPKFERLAGAIATESQGISQLPLKFTPENESEQKSQLKKENNLANPKLVRCTEQQAISSAIFKKMHQNPNKPLGSSLRSHSENQVPEVSQPTTTKASLVRSVPMLPSSGRASFNAKLTPAYANQRSELSGPSKTSSPRKGKGAHNWKGLANSAGAFKTDLTSKARISTMPMPAANAISYNKGTPMAIQRRPPTLLLCGNKPTNVNLVIFPTILSISTPFEITKAPSIVELGFKVVFEALPGESKVLCPLRTAVTLPLHNRNDSWCMVAVNAVPRAGVTIPKANIQIPLSLLEEILSADPQRDRLVAVHLRFEGVPSNIPFRERFGVYVTPQLSRHVFLGPFSCNYLPDRRSLPAYMKVIAPSADPARLLEEQRQRKIDELKNTLKSFNISPGLVIELVSPKNKEESYTNRATAHRKKNRDEPDIVTIECSEPKRVCRPS